MNPTLKNLIILTTALFLLNWQLGASIFFSCPSIQMGQLGVPVCGIFTCVTLWNNNFESVCEKSLDIYSQKKRDGGGPWK